MINTKRYFYSFFLTTALYLIIFVSIFYSYESFIVKNKKIEDKSIDLNFVSLISQEKIVKKEPIVKKEEIKKEIKKEIIKKTIKKEPIIEKKVVKKTTPKEIKEKPKKEIKKIVKKEQERIIKSVKKSYEENFLDEHLKLIAKLIQQNIEYPRMAKRLNIQGSVLVKFIILSNGSVKSIEAINGHKLLIKATIEAIESASKKFPKVKKDITIKVPILYCLT